MKHIVKTHGKTEPYDKRKLYASIYASCVSVGRPKKTAELVANDVEKAVGVWLSKKSEVSSQDLREIAGKQLDELDKTAAVIYKHHRIIW